MNNFIERMRNAIRRTADRVTGQHVPVATSPATNRCGESGSVRIGIVASRSLTTSTPTRRGRPCAAAC